RNDWREGETPIKRVVLFKFGEGEVFWSAAIYRRFLFFSAWRPTEKEQEKAAINRRTPKGRSPDARLGLSRVIHDDANLAPVGPEISRGHRCAGCPATHRA